MNDKDFIKYLAKKLLNSGEDCCSVCAYNTDKAADCDNLKAHDVPDDTICTAGLRAYADKNTSAKSTKLTIEQLLEELKNIQLEVESLSAEARTKLAMFDECSEPHRRQSKKYVYLESAAAYIYSSRKYLVELKG